jgi:hypothetical protein
MSQCRAEELEIPCLNGQERCGKWMPRKKATCARTPGHGGPCKTAVAMERNRLYNRDHPHRESPESRKKSNRKYRISSYGLTQEQFDRLLDAQQRTCGMCHEPFEEGQLIHVNHDHACCRGKPIVRSVRPRIPVSYLQHRAGLHRTPIGDGSRLPRQPSHLARRRRLAFKRGKPCAGIAATRSIRTARCTCSSGASGRAGRPWPPIADSS